MPHDECIMENAWSCTDAFLQSKVWQPLQLMLGRSYASLTLRRCIRTLLDAKAQSHS